MQIICSWLIYFLFIRVLQVTGEKEGNQEILVTKYVPSIGGFRTIYLGIWLHEVNILLLFLRVRLVWMEREADLELLDNLWVSKLDADFHKQLSLSLHLPRAGRLYVLSLTYGVWQFQGQPGPRGQQGPKGAKGDQVRLSKQKHFLHVGPMLCVWLTVIVPLSSW